NLKSPFATSALHFRCGCAVYVAEPIISTNGCLQLAISVSFFLLLSPCLSVYLL
ncbi:hypothetical protein OIU85_008882, partial [Salix viminalis]